MHCITHTRTQVLLTILMLGFTGCIKVAPTSGLDTGVIAGYYGRTWQVDQIKAVYPRFLPGGQAYDSIIVYPHDTTVHLFFDINWKLEMHPVLQGALQLQGSTTWAFQPGVISIGSASGITRCTVGEYYPGSKNNLPYVMVTAFVADTLANRPTGSSKRVDVLFSLMGEGRFM